MQYHSSKESEIKIPPNLLKNFNVYDVLEPEKNSAKNSDATKVDKLVDIDDCSQDSGFQDSDVNPAFLDKNRDFDLVDLYQNMFVTPQHIKKKEATNEVETPFSAPKAIDAGFKQFCDMLESGEKIDWTKITQTEEKTIPEHDFIEKEPRVLVPKVFTEPDSDPEDIIHEVLIQKKLEQLACGNIKSNSFKGYSSEPLKRESPKMVIKSDVIPEFSRSNFNGKTKDSKFESRSNGDVPRPSEFEPYPVHSQTNNSLPTFTVRAIQKDEKVYKKKRLVKPENQTANYTRGPDFNEKSVVLPQIMERLHARQAYLDEKYNQKKRLILDAGAKPKAEANAQVKRNLNNQASTSTSYVNAQVKTKPAESSSFAKNVLTKKAPNNASNSGMHSLKLNNVGIQKEAQLCINKVTKDIRVHTTDKPCLNCSNPSTAARATTADSTAGASTKNDYGKLSPVILMEDCNKERLRALKQSQMFKEFVLKGQYDL